MFCRDKEYLSELVVSFLFRCSVQTKRSTVQSLAVHDRDHVQRMQSVFPVRVQRGVYPYVAGRRLHLSERLP